jgi:hypothetical protein
MSDYRLIDLFVSKMTCLSIAVKDLSYSLE